MTSRRKEQLEEKQEGGKHRYECWSETRRQAVAGATDVDTHRSVVRQGLCLAAAKWLVLRILTPQGLQLLVDFPLAAIGNNFILNMCMYVWEPHTYVACLSLV